MSTTVPTIHQLRARGFKVRVTHERVTGFESIDNGPFAPLFQRVTKEGKKAKLYPILHEKGGVTTLEVTDAAGQSARAVAKCNLKDPFNRKLGNHICLARLQKRGVI